MEKQDIELRSKEFEVRYISELRANSEDGIIRGTAIRFNSQSEDLGGFREIIECKPQEVLDLLNTQDIVMLYNHDENSNYNVLARSKNGKGSLKYTVDEYGVHFEFKAKKKDIGIVESIEAGDLDGCSFSFRMNYDDTTAQRWDKQPDGTYLRHIFKFDAIRDFSIVVTPAYSTTSVSVRAQLEELQKADKQALDDVENRNKDFEDYIKNLKRKYL